MQMMLHISEATLLSVVELWGALSWAGAFWTVHLLVFVLHMRNRRSQSGELSCGLNTAVAVRQL